MLSDWITTIAVLQGHLDWVRAIEYMPDGTIVTGSKDKKVIIWNPWSWLLSCVFKRHGKYDRSAVADARTHIEPAPHGAGAFFQPT